MNPRDIAVVAAVCAVGLVFLVAAIDWMAQPHIPYHLRSTAGWGRT